MIIVLFVISRIPKESYGFLNRSSDAFLLNDGAKKVQTSVEPSLLELCRVQPFLLRSAKIRLFSDTAKFRVAIRLDFQQPLILNLVNKANSYFCGGKTIAFFDGKHSSSWKKISPSCDFSQFLYPLQFPSKSYSSYSSYSSDSSELTP